MGECLTFEALGNTRDLGGMPTAGGRRIREGLLFRSEQLFFATERDRETLDSLGIGKVFDFRSALERDEKPDPEIAGAENVHLPIIEDVRTGITHGEGGRARMAELIMGGGVDTAFVDKHMQEMYGMFVTDPSAHAQYARFIDEAIGEAQRGKAVLWHCTAGKDRAGFATVIILEALGVDRDLVFEDYLMTNECLEGTIEGLMAMLADKLPNIESAEAIRKFFRADESYLQAAYDAMQSRFWTAEGFLEQAIGIDSAKREAMRGLFLV